MSQLSRFSNTPKTVFDGVETYAKWVPPSFIRTRPDPSLIFTYYVQPEAAGRPDKISQDIYGTPDLFWILIAFNDARAALNWPKAGTLIEYPVESIVLQELL